MFSTVGLLKLIPVVVANVERALLHPPVACHIYSSRPALQSVLPTFQTEQEYHKAMICTSKVPLTDCA